MMVTRQADITANVWVGGCHGTGSSGLNVLRTHRVREMGSKSTEGGGGVAALGEKGQDTPVIIVYSSLSVRNKGLHWTCGEITAKRRALSFVLI